MTVATSFTDDELDGVLDLLEQGLPFAGPTSYLRAPRTRDLTGADVVAVGVPYDGGCSNRSGTRFGPRVLREQSVYAGALQPVYPYDFDTQGRFRIVDFGDVAAMPGNGASEYLLAATEAVAARVFTAGARFLGLGGDHTLPYGPIRAAHKHFGQQIAIVHLDSHQDSWPTDLPRDTSQQLVNHGTFMAAMAQEGIADMARSTQLYVRTHMPAAPAGGYRIYYAEEAIDLGWQALAEELRGRLGDTPCYLTFDIDAVDPAYAPGNGSPVPCGPSSTEVRRLLRALSGLNLVGADLLEVNPLYDHDGTTAVLGAFLSIDMVHLLGGAKTAHG